MVQQVTWVEHSEVDDRGVHRLYQPLVSSGLAFGAQRWLANLRRQCETMHVANNLQIPTNLPTPDLGKFSSGNWETTLMGDLIH